MKETIIKVNGMMCEGCENRIKNAVGRIEGVEDVVADHNEGTVKVTTNDEVDINKVEETISDIGFEVV